MQRTPSYHTPVLGPEVVTWLVGDPSGVYVDGTLGGGGHAERLLERMGERGRLIGIDRDPEAIREASVRLHRFGERVQVVQAPFWKLPRILCDLGIAQVAGVLFDLGLSSRQIDDASRGFSYLQDGPLDMRMGPDARRSAGEVINTYSQRSLVQIFRDYGEERAAPRIARAICRRREQAPLTRTSELADLIVGEDRGGRPQKTLARIFQAVRIEVNEELDPLRGALEGAVGALQAGGRIGVLTYHSLEDRTVKQVFRDAARGCICPPRLPVCGCGRVATLKVLTRKGVRAGAEERESNPRARSATLRVAEHTGAEGGGQAPVAPRGGAGRGDRPS